MIIKYPSNYINDNGTNKLVYINIKIDAAKFEKYRKWTYRLETIFTQDKNAKELYDDINTCLIECIDRDINFIYYNQWILRFASNQTVELVQQKISLDVEEIDTIVNVYINDNVKHLIRKKEMIPKYKIPEKAKENEILMEIINNDNYLDDTISSFSKSKSLLIQKVIKNNTWILMHINENKRKIILDRFNIEYKSLILPIGFKYENQLRLVSSEVSVPINLIAKYMKYNEILTGLFKNNNFAQNLYNSAVEDINLLIDNFWLSEMVLESDRNELINLIECMEYLQKPVLKNKEKKNTIIKSNLNLLFKEKPNFAPFRIVKDEEQGEKIWVTAVNLEKSIFVLKEIKVNDTLKDRVKDISEKIFELKREYLSNPTINVEEELNKIVENNQDLLQYLPWYENIKEVAKIIRR